MLSSRDTPVAASEDSFRRLETAPSLNLGLTSDLSLPFNGHAYPLNPDEAEAYLRLLHSSYEAETEDNTKRAATTDQHLAPTLDDDNCDRLHRHCLRNAGSLYPLSSTLSLFTDLLRHDIEPISLCTNMSAQISNTSTIVAAPGHLDRRNSARKGVGSTGALILKTEANSGKLANASRSKGDLPKWAGSPKVPSVARAELAADSACQRSQTAKSSTVVAEGPSSTPSSDTLTPAKFESLVATMAPALNNGFEAGGFDMLGPRNGELPTRPFSGVHGSSTEPGADAFSYGPFRPFDLYSSSDAKLKALQLEMHLNELAARQASILVQAERESLLREQREILAPRSTPAFADAENLRAMTNIYINNLPESTTDEALFRLGSVCGNVVSHKAMIDLDKGYCKGYGFVMYATPQEAQRAIIWFSSNGFQTSYAKESFSAKLRRMADKNSTNVYLSNLPVKLNAQQLEQLFVPHVVVSLRILTDANGESRGVGFVRLKDRDVAQECIDRLHGNILPGTTQPLQVRFADSEAQKQLKQSVSTRRTIESLGLNVKNRSLQDMQQSALFGDSFTSVSQQSLMASPDLSTSSSSSSLGSWHSHTSDSQGSNALYSSVTTPSALVSQPPTSLTMSKELYGSLGEAHRIPAFVEMMDRRSLYNTLPSIRLGNDNFDMRPKSYAIPIRAPHHDGSSSNNNTQSPADPVSKEGK